ncbi:putative non-structural polyprotein [Myrmica rubra picorna-like virus 12]|nr:putative non-structural polyprotein [Myrmica rubra picorna-like virus 12]
MQLPGSYVYDRWSAGTYQYCQYTPTAQDFQVNELELDNQQMEEQSLVDDYYEAKQTVTDIKTFVGELREDTLPAVLGHAKLFHKDLNDTHNTIKEFIPKLQEVFDTVHTTGVKINLAAEANQRMSDSITGCTEWVKMLMQMSNLACLFYHVQNLFNKFTFGNLFLVINQLAWNLGVFQEVGKWIVEQLFSLSSDFSNLKHKYFNFDFTGTQSEGCRPKATNGTEVSCEQGMTEFIMDHQEEFSFSLAAIATVIYCAMFGVMPKWSTIKEAIYRAVSKEDLTEQGFGSTSEFLKSIHFSNLGFKAINNAFDFFQEYVNKIINWFLGKEANAVILEREFKEKAEAIELWIDEIAELEDEDYYQLALSDIEIHNRFYKLMDQGREFTKWLMREGVSKNVSSIIRDTMKRLESMVKRINEQRPAHGFRYAPFSVWFHGPSSTGKSRMMHAVTDELREILDCPYYNSVYSVPTTDKYLSGYNGQAIVEWDDILQNTNQDELVGQFIQWCSNADCKINMAELADKGKHFTSKAIVATTNCAYHSVNTIRDIDAFRRRRNVLIGVDFVHGHDARTMVDAPQDPEFRHAVFAILDPINEGQVIRPGLTFNQVKDYIRERFTAWDRKQNNLVREYMETHGSLRIPRGVIIETQEDDNEEEFHEAEEQGLVKYVNCKLDSKLNLTEEEELDASIFIENFKILEEEEKWKAYTMFSKIKAKIPKKVTNFYNLIKLKLGKAKDSLQEEVRQLYLKYPKLSATLATLTVMTVAGMTIKMMVSMFSSKVSDVIPEAVYEFQTPKQVTKLIRTENSYSQNVPKNVTVITKAENTYNQNTPKIKTSLVKCEAGVYDNATLKVPSKVVRAEGLEHGTHDPAAIELARNKIHPLLSFVGWHECDYQLSLQAFSIGGKFILVPHHFFRRAKDGDFFWIIQGGQNVLVEFASARMQRIRDKDLCVYWVGAAFDSRKNILNCFIEEKHLSLISKECPAVLVGTTMKGHLMEKTCQAKGNVEMKYHGDDDGAPTYVQHGWSYDINTVAGECGSPLIATSKLLPPPSKIIGIHTAGYKNKRGGFAIVITREMVQEALNVLIEKFGPQVTGMSLPPQINVSEQAFNEQVKIKPTGYFSYYGTMRSDMCPSQPEKTQLQPTPFHGECYPVTKAPAKLKADSNGSPLIKALNKYGNLTVPFQIKHIKAVRNSILNDLMELKSEMAYEPTSLTTAVFGIPGVKYCEPLNFNSSPGWPYQCLPNSKGEVGKRYLFDVNERQITDSLLIRNIEEREKFALQGERFPSIWRDCLKDELRPMEKVLAGKTRLFTIAPVDYTILVRKYFLSFEQAFYAGHSKFFSAVGINPESFEWTAAYNRLRSFGSDAIAGDFTCYDGTLMADLMYECGEVINDWYALNGELDEAPKLVRRVLIDEMIHTYQLVQNCVYKTHQGNPSGNPLTVILNTMVNCFYMRLAWMEIMSSLNPILATMDAYSQNVVEEMYGDDNRLVVKRAVLQWFNQVSITDCLAKHGIVYTDESKSTTLLHSRPLLETSFLKRKYRFDDEIGKEIILPTMAEETITELTNWYRNSDDLEGQLQQNQRAACYFAFFHGREYFNNFNNKFSQKMRENNLKPLSLTYEEYLNIFVNDVHGEDQNYSKLCDFMTF